MKTSIAAAAIALAVLAACAAVNGGPRQYPLPQIGPVLGLAPGPDGKMWFTQAKAKAVGSITPGGSIQMFQNPPDIDADPQSIATGPDGALWFTQISPHDPVDSGPDMIGRISTNGRWSEYPIPSWDALPAAIAAGPDRAMWFAERRANAIGRISMQGKITEFRLPHAGSGPTGIVRGSDGRMWFTETDGNRIGNIDPLSGKIVEFTLPAAKSKPGPIASGQDGTLYVVELSRRKIAWMAKGGSILETATQVQPVDVAVAGQGAVWYAASNGDICRLTPPSVIVLGDVSPVEIAPGANGTIWFAVKKGPSFSYARTGGIGAIDASAIR